MKRALIIGYGSIGRRHARVLLASGLMDEIDLVTKQPVADHTCYGALENVPRLRTYDYFVIASETAKHYAQLVSLDEKVRDKTILVEKAVFHRPCDFSSSRNTVFVGYNMRFDPIIEKLHNDLRSTRTLFAQLYVGQYLPLWHPWADYRNSYSAQKKMGGGVALDLSHELDYAQYLFGHVTECVGLAEHVSDLEIETDDLFTCVARTDQHTVLNITTDYLNRKATRTLLLHTPDASYAADFMANTLVRTGADGAAQIWNFAPDDDRPYREMHHAALRREPGRLCTLAQGIGILWLLDGIFHKKTTWGRVNV